VSATVAERPKERRSSANGITQSPKGGVVNEDSSLLVTEDQLRRFGDGDAKRGRAELRALLAAEKDSTTFVGPAAQPTTVRRAEITDEEALLELWLMDLRSNAEHVALIDEAKVLENIRSGTRGRGGILGVIDDKQNGPIAMVLLQPVQWHWSQAWFLQEMVLYVHPDHRKSHHADHLAEWSKWAADEMTRHFGYRVHLLNGVLGTWQIHRKTAFYRRKFQQVGTVFLYPSPFRKGD
jgi:GNAT superfamily N-acetyltransferase